MEGDTAFSIAEKLGRPYAVADAWSSVKRKVSAANVRLALRCICAASKGRSIVTEKTNPLQNFFHREGAMNIVHHIMTAWSGFPAASLDDGIDPRFLDDVHDNEGEGGGSSEGISDLPFQDDEFYIDYIEHEEDSDDD